MIKKYFFSILAGGLLAPLSVLAVALPILPAGGPINAGLVAVGFINSLISILWPLFLGFAVMMFIIAGFLFLTANGNASKIDTAKKAVIWGVIGVAVGILAFSIPFMVAMLLGTGL